MIFIAIFAAGEGGGVWLSTKLYVALFLLFPIISLCLLMKVCDLCAWGCWSCNLSFSLGASERVFTLYFQFVLRNVLLILRSDDCAVCWLRDANINSGNPVLSGPPGQSNWQKERTAPHPEAGIPEPLCGFFVTPEGP